MPVAMTVHKHVANSAPTALVWTRQPPPLLRLEVDMYLDLFPSLPDCTALVSSRPVSEWDANELQACGFSNDGTYLCSLAQMEKDVWHCVSCSSNFVKASAYHGQP